MGADQFYRNIRFDELLQRVFVFGRLIFQVSFMFVFLTIGFMDIVSDRDSLPFYNQCVFSHVFELPNFECLWVKVWRSVENGLETV